MRIITISRKFGSGYREPEKHLAGLHGIDYLSCIGMGGKYADTAFGSL